MRSQRGDRCHGRCTCFESISSRVFLLIRNVSHGSPMAVTTCIKEVGNEPRVGCVRLSFGRLEFGVARHLRNVSTPPRIHGIPLTFTSHHILITPSCGETSTVFRCLCPKVPGEGFAVQRAGQELNAQLFSQLCFHEHCATHTFMTASFT
jgi:hypothetical protein